MRLDLRLALQGVVSSISAQNWDLAQPPLQQSKCVSIEQEALIHTHTQQHRYMSLINQQMPAVPSAESCS